MSKSIYHYLILFFILVCFHFACQNESTPKNKIISTPQFTFETRIDSIETPHSSIYISFDDNKIKIAEISTCLKILKEEFERHDVPANAIDACGGWWAGVGDYLYLIEEDEQYVVYKGYQDEMQEDPGYHYKMIGQLSKTGNYLQKK